MNSTGQKFANINFSRSSINLQNFNSIMIPSANSVQLLQMIKQYETHQQCEQQTEEEKQETGQISFNQISDVCIEPYLKNNIKPVRMFKDRMELQKQNIQKKIIVKELENVNKKLKLEYDVSLNNNHKMEMFLKQIQFTFKNDRSNQKANETLMKATKTLHREKQQSKNYIQKLVKTAKTNQMRELKSYLKVLDNQKNRLLTLLTSQTAQNQSLRQAQDFNKQQLAQFQTYQSQMTQILSYNLHQTSKIRDNYKKQKTQIKISLTLKQVQYIKHKIIQIDQSITNELFNKEGLEYQLEVIKNKLKERNKRNIKQEGSILKQEIKRKHKKILLLEQQLKQKTKTQQYIVKWSKQLKFQLEQLKTNLAGIKNTYKDQINKLSKQIEQWNGKYKVELIQQQNINKKGQIRQTDMYNRQNTAPERKIRVVKIYEIEQLRKKIIFHVVENNIDVLQFIQENILYGYNRNRSITLKELSIRLENLGIFEDQEPAELYKLARYIVQDNNCNYTKINPQQTIQISIALLIFKNLLTTDLSYSNLPQIKQQLTAFLDKNFDQIRHQIWLNSQKSPTFNLINLRNAFAKYITSQLTIQKYVQFVQYMIWKKYEQAGGCYKLGNFQKVCEILLGRKLVKDNSNRISKTTIRSVFDQMYNLKSSGGNGGSGNAGGSGSGNVSIKSNIINTDENGSKKYAMSHASGKCISVDDQINQSSEDSQQGPL